MIIGDLDAARAVRVELQQKSRQLASAPAEISPARFLRNHRNILPYREGERAERGEVTLSEVAAHLKVSEPPCAVSLGEQILPADQLCKGAPRVIRADDLGRDIVRHAADARRLRHRPLSHFLRNALDYARRRVDDDYLQKL
jgi:sulfur carrier protein ThiS